MVSPWEIGKTLGEHRRWDPWDCRAAGDLLPLGAPGGCFTPLKNHGVRQLGWLFLIYGEKHMFQTTNQAQLGFASLVFRRVLAVSYPPKIFFQLAIHFKDCANEVYNMFIPQFIIMESTWLYQKNNCTEAVKGAESSSAKAPIVDFIDVKRPIPLLKARNGVKWVTWVGYGSQLCKIGGFASGLTTELTTVCGWPFPLLGTGCIVVVHHNLRQFRVFPPNKYQASLVWRSLEFSRINGERYAQRLMSLPICQGSKQAPFSSKAEMAPAISAKGKVSATKNALRGERGWDKTHQTTPKIPSSCGKPNSEPSSMQVYFLGYWVCDPQMATFWDRRTIGKPWLPWPAMTRKKNHGWLVVSTLPLWKIWVRPWEGWHPIIWWKIKHVPNHQPVGLSSGFSLPPIRKPWPKVTRWLWAFTHPFPQDILYQMWQWTIPLNGGS